VTFRQANNNTLGTASLSGGVARITVRYGSTGSRTIRAIYGGDAQNAGSTSNSLTVRTTN
jgi:hypothetical protein